MAGLLGAFAVLMGLSATGLGATEPGSNVLGTTPAEAPRSWSAGEIAKGIDRLGVTGSVLYVAAHPDDENTRLIGWLVGARGVRTTYLSLTRGDGGQNLVGSELGDLLGVIRTYELLGARAVDGAEQRFTRAVDFGYSKTADETLKIWDRDEVLRDVVQVVRELKPDVIVTRFQPTGRGHGHHLASAILAREAFDAAADPARFPESAQRFGAWQVSRLVYNKSTWRLPKDTDLSAFAHVDVGGYDPLTGASWGEIAAASRSQHKSQGFGSSPTYGPKKEYFVPIADALGGPVKAGVAAAATDPIFGGVDTSWGRYKDGKSIQRLIEELRRGFDPGQPEASLPKLAALHRALGRLPSKGHVGHTRLRKQAEVEALMIAAAGLRVDALAESEAVIPGGPATARIDLLLRRAAPAELNSVTWPDGSVETPRRSLEVHTPLTVSHTWSVAADANPSTPYWLRDPRGGGLHTVRDRTQVGQPIGPPPLEVHVGVTVAGVKLTLRRPLLHRWTDRVRGALAREVEVRPPVTATPAGAVLMLPGAKAQTLRVTLRAHTEAVAGTASLKAPRGWRVTPSRHKVALDKPGDEAIIAFTVRPPSAQARPAELEVQVRATSAAVAASTTWSLAEDVVDHPHIPQRTVLRPASVRAVPVDLNRGGAGRIAYVPGAGDDVAESLRQVGYDVSLIEADALHATDLSAFDALVFGIRAFNVHPRLFQSHAKVMAWVKAGGTVLAQYNTNNRWRKLPGSLGPAPFEIDRGRVTDETAPLKPLAPAHPALNHPNRLGAADYSGWVQERGLYFAKSWDASYTPIFESADPGADPEQGALLVARHGAGAFIYSGISFFRQLPAGVPGAYRLLANLLALDGRAAGGRGASR